MARAGRARPIPHRQQRRTPAFYAESGSVTLTGAGTLTLAGNPALAGSVTLTGAGTLTLAGAAILPGEVTMAGAGTLSLTGIRLKPILLVSIASSAGTDDFGNDYPQGLGVFDNGLIIGSTIKTEGSSGGLFIYGGGSI